MEMHSSLVLMSPIRRALKLPSLVDTARTSPRQKALKNMIKKVTLKRAASKYEWQKQLNNMERPFKIVGITGLR